MTVNFNPNLSAVSLGDITAKTGTGKIRQGSVDFGKVVTDSLNSVSGKQAEANASIIDLLSGKNEDINSVVAAVAKADMSFKLLVGVRNKLVDAYKETMKMPI